MVFERKKKDNKIRYLEDILKQDSFTLEELRGAKARYPLLCWFKGKKFWIEDWFDLTCYKIRRKIRRIIDRLFLT